MIAVVGVLALAVLLVYAATRSSWSAAERRDEPDDPRKQGGFGG